MDTQEIRTLKLLEELESEKTPSQRDLAIRLNISLGLVNSFVKRLAKKGYLKITHIPKNRVRYILTPKGAAEKTRLTYDYIQYSLQFYKSTRNRLIDLFGALETRNLNRIVFYGVNEISEIAYLLMKEYSLDLAGILDESQAGQRFFSKTVELPQVLPAIKFDRVLLTMYTGKAEALQVLNRLEIDEKRIIRSF